MTPTASRLVLSAGVGLFLAMLGYVLRFGSNSPVHDEWHLVEQIELAGDVPWDWFVALHNEHRYPLGKLLWWLSLQGGNFRVSTFLSVAALGAATLILALTLKKNRGHTSVADVIAVALLLNWGHWFTLLMGYQLGFAMIALLGVSAACAIATTTPLNETRRGFQVAGLGLLLMLNGGFGVGLVVPLMLWIGVIGLKQRRISLFIGPLLAAVYVIAVTLLTPKPNWVAWQPPSLEVFAAAFAGYLGSGFGDIAINPGPLSIPLTVLTVLLHVAAIVVALAALWNAENRPAGLGLLAVLLGQFLVAGGIAWYRHYGLQIRFTAPSVIGLAACLLIFTRFGPPLRFAKYGFATLALLIVIGNLKPAYREGLTQRNFIRGFLNDVKAGQTSSRFLAGKWGGSFWTLDPLGTIIERLRRGRYGDFDRIPPEPRFTVQQFTLNDGMIPAATACDFAAGRQRSNLTVPEAPRRVLALRLRIRQTTIYGWQEVKLTWTGRDGVRTATAYPRFYPGDHDLIFVINDRPRDITLEPCSLCGGLPILSCEWLIAD